MNRRQALGRATRITGVLLTLVGIVILSLNQATLGVLLQWSPVAVLAIGTYLLYRAVFLRARAGYLFNGLVLVLGGGFTLLLSTGILPAGWTLRELWPVYVGIIGVSLIPFGARYRRTVRISLIIPGIFLIILMVVFLLFSLSVVKESLAEFVGKWWPLLLIFMGVTMLGSSWFSQPESKD